MSNVSGPRREPGSTLERAANAALDALELELRAAGATVERAYLIVTAAGLPPGELDMTTAGAGYDDTRDILADLLVHATAVGEAHGMTIVLAPLNRG